MDNIFKQDYSEISNRQQLKIEYLQKQNESLTQNLQFLESQLQRKNSQIAHIQESQQDQTLNSISQENSILNQELQRLKREQDIAESKAFLNSQMKQQTEEFYKEILVEYEEKIQELRKVIHDKEYSVQELEKVKPFQETDGVIVKIREIVSLNEQTLRYHNEIENLQLTIQKQAKEHLKLTESYAKCQQQNQKLKLEFQKIKHAAFNQMNYTRIKQYLISEPEIFSDDEYVNSIQIVKQTKPQNENTVNNPPQMVKTKSMNVNTPINSFLSPKNDRMTKLELDIERYKKLFERELLNNRMLCEQLDKVQKHNKQLEVVNKKLIQSNVKLNKSLNFLHQIEGLAKKIFQKYAMQGEEEKKDGDNHEYSLEIADERVPNRPKMGRQRSSELNLVEKKKVVQGSIICSGAVAKKRMELGECKSYLMMLAKELYRNQSLSQVSQSRKGRSLSDPCLYVSKEYMEFIRSAQKPLKIPILRKVRKVEMGDEEVSVIPAQQHVCNDHGIELSFFSQNDILIQ